MRSKPPSRLAPHARACEHGPSRPRLAAAPALTEEPPQRLKREMPLALAAAWVENALLGKIASLQGGMSSFSAPKSLPAPGKTPVSTANGRRAAVMTRRQGGITTTSGITIRRREGTLPATRLGSKVGQIGTRMSVGTRFDTKIRRASTRPLTKCSARIPTIFRLLLIIRQRPIVAPFHRRHRRHLLGPIPSHGQVQMIGEASAFDSIHSV